MKAAPYGISLVEHIIFELIAVTFYVYNINSYLEI